MQVTISKRQHIRFDFGIRIPVNNTSGRPVQTTFYFALGLAGRPPK